MKKTYKIEVDCANCANLMEQAARKTPGVREATVNYMALKMTVEFEEGQDPKAVMAQVLKNCKKVEDDFIVEVSGVPTIGQLTINCKGKDIEIDAVRLINDDLESILVDLKINTYLKEDIAKIMFGKDTISHKRIAIRKLKKKGLSKEYIQLFLRLLEYISEF